MRGRVLAFSLAALVGGLVYGGWRLWRTWSYRTALMESQRHVDAGRYAVAARNLAALLAREPESDEAAFLLGFCAKALGRPKQAIEAWERVRPGAPAAGRAALGRATLLVDLGRLADAETFVNEVLADSRIDGQDLMGFLGSLYWYEGRRDEALRLLETKWDRLRRAGHEGSDQAIELVRLRIALIEGISSADSVRAFLDRAAELAPDDDRVWLAKANLAIQQGELVAAARWLDACRDRRPDDVAVWRSRLEWAMATARVPAVRDALKHLPVGESPAEIHRLAAWFASQRADRDAERRALDSLLLIDPHDGPAVDRLTELAIASNQPKLAADLRRRKSEIDQLKLQYQKLFLRNQPVRDAVEIASLAQRLGRQFEAKVFLTVATSSSPARADLQDALARVERADRDAKSAKSGLTLAEALASEIDSPPRPSIRVRADDLVPPRAAQGRP